MPRRRDSGLGVYVQCGEPLFEGREVDVIQEAIKALDNENEQLLTAT